MKEYSDLNHSSCAAKSLTITNSYALLSTVKLFGKKQKLTASSMLKAKTTSPDTTNKLKRADEKYDCLLMLCAVEVIKNLRSVTKTSRQHL